MSGRAGLELHTQAAAVLAGLGTACHIAANTRKNTLADQHGRSVAAAVVVVTFGHWPTTQRTCQLVCVSRVVSNVFKLALFPGT
jgi:hypothetical protein